MRPNLETIRLYCRWEKYAAPIDVGISHEVKCRNTLATDAGICLSINNMSFFNLPFQAYFFSAPAHELVALLQAPFDVGSSFLYSFLPTVQAILKNCFWAKIVSTIP